MSILCKVGMHKWTYTPAVYDNSQMQYLGIPSVEATRTCQRCGKYQKQDVHCLGFNPPDYVYRWY